MVSSVSHSVKKPVAGLVVEGFIVENRVVTPSVSHSVTNSVGVTPDCVEYLMGAFGVVSSVSHSVRNSVVWKDVGATSGFVVINDASVSHSVANSLAVLGCKVVFLAPLVSDCSLSHSVANAVD